MADTTVLTDDDRKVLRTAIMQSCSMVSMAEPGFFDSFKEAFASSKAVRAASPELQALVVGGFPSFPSVSSPEDFEKNTLDTVRHAAQIMAAKAPALHDGFKQMLIESVKDVAAAANGISAKEQAAIDKITAAFA